MNEAKPTDPLFDETYWKFRVKCRNCGVVADYELGDKKSLHHLDFVKTFNVLKGDRDAVLQYCNSCGAWAFHDWIAIAKEPE